MLENIPFFISLLIFAIIAVQLYLVYLSTRSTKIILALLVWSIIQSAIAYSGFYASNLDALPPRIIFAFLLAFGFIFWFAFSKKGIAISDTWNLQYMTLTSIIRVPVEIMLLLLATSGAVSYLQTFEGWNFDILSGITAPLIAYFGFKGGTINKKLLLPWNIICLLLLCTIITISILAAPFPLQQLSFEQPNRAILYFPFCLLPMLIVPIVFCFHLVSIRRLLKMK